MIHLLPGAFMHSIVSMILYFTTAGLLTTATPAAVLIWFYSCLLGFMIFFDVKGEVRKLKTLNIPPRPLWGSILFGLWICANVSYAMIHLELIVPAFIGYFGVLVMMYKRMMIHNLYYNYK
jgi:hypothetical protein